MQTLFSFIANLPDLLLVILAFSLIIIIHEAGHFLAARWAGVRVLAFAVGFGPALFSYRRGMGLRRGSSEPEYNRLRTEGAAGAARPDERGVSPTEYRLNALPFGGYVKMLGQEDINPGARSDEPDSYQNVPIWKRMVIISAGVVFNLITAAALFIVVFMMGLRTEPPALGEPLPGSPAAAAVAVNAAEQGIAEPGLRAGDVVRSINGDRPASFNDLIIDTAMADKRYPISLEIERPGVDGLLRFEIRPDVDPASKLLSLGIRPIRSGVIMSSPAPDVREQIQKMLADKVSPELEPGMRLVSAAGQPVSGVHELANLANSRGGRPFPADFELPGRSGEPARRVTVEIRPTPRYQSADFEIAFRGDTEGASARHLLGLTPVMMVQHAGDDAKAAGLQDGDVFARLGSAQWPSFPDGIAEVRRRAGETIEVVVARRDDADGWTLHDLGRVPVSREGIIGFAPGDTASEAALVAAWPSVQPAPSTVTPRAAMIDLPPGSEIVAVNGAPVASFEGLYAALLSAAVAAGPEAETVGVELTVLPPPGAGTDRTPRTLTWTIPGGEAAELASLGWTSPLPPELFEPRQIELVASNPVEAIAMGIGETHRVMMTTYITFARLFQGSVKVGHLKGPVGIAHAGTLLADRGLVWLMFFMALVSVNLAVINFLPIPIADGGHFVFLSYEALTGRPPPVAFQNAAMLAGLVLLAGLFMIVTFNDLMNLFRG